QAGLGVFIDGLYNAGRIHTANKRAGFIACASACTAHGVGRAHGSGLYTNQDFAWSGCWSWEFVNLENFWTTGGMKCNSFHIHHSRATGSDIPEKIRKVWPLPKLQVWHAGR